MSFINIMNVSKNYPDFKLDSISEEIEEGKITGLIGVNGSGKTTLIKSILNLINVDSGEIKVFNENIIGKKEEYIKNLLGVVLDSGYYYNDITVREASLIYGEVYSSWNKNLFDEKCKLFGLDSQKKISQLSKGMKMKLSVAIATSKNSRGLIMDEPTSGLDPLIRKEILQAFRKYISETNSSLLFSTHITSDLETIADRILLLNKGKVLYHGTKDNFKTMFYKVKFDGDKINDDLYNIKRIGNNEFEGYIEEKNKGKFSNIKECTLEEIMFIIIGREIWVEYIYYLLEKT